MAVGLGRPWGLPLGPEENPSPPANPSVIIYRNACPKIPAGTTVAGAKFDIHGVPNVRVIFLQDASTLAHAGDVKNVKDGYARNYLIPQKLAEAATSEGMKRIERIKQTGDERRMRETNRWEDLAASLDGTNITVAARVTPAGQYYGAITPTQIAQQLTEATGREIDRKLIDTVQPIREPGEHEIILNLAPGIQVTIIVTAETQEI